MEHLIDTLHNVHSCNHAISSLCTHRHFSLVVALHADTAQGSFPVVSHVSERIIVRVSLILWTSLTAWHAYFMHWFVFRLYTLKLLLLVLDIYSTHIPHRLLTQGTLTVIVTTAGSELQILRLHIIM